MTETATNGAGQPGQWVRRLQEVTRQLFERGMQAAGVELTPLQFAALANVRDRPGIDPSTLGADVGCDQAAIGSVIEHLAAKGWVRGDACQVITPEGVATLLHIQPWIEKIQSEFVAPMGEPERRQFAQRCRELLGHHQE